MAAKDKAPEFDPTGLVLATNVHVDGQVVPAGTAGTAELGAQIPNPKAWTDPGAGGAGDQPDQGATTPTE